MKRLAADSCRIEDYSASYGIGSCSVAWTLDTHAARVQTRRARGGGDVRPLPPSELAADSGAATHTKFLLPNILGGMDMVMATCPNCGKPFTPWRKKIFCSDKCRRQSENRRLGYSQKVGSRGDAGTTPLEGPGPLKKDKQNQGAAEKVRRDETPGAAVTRREGPVEVVRNSRWIAINEVTRKLDFKGTAIGWLMKVEGHTCPGPTVNGWYGRVRDERGEFSFGPTSQPERAMKAVEAWLRHEPFGKREGENSWGGTLWTLIGGRDTPHLLGS